MTMPPRIVSVLVPLQMTVLFLGYTISRKFISYHHTTWLAAFHDDRWWQYVPPPVRFMSEACWVLFLLPVVWGLLACLRAETVGMAAEIRCLDARIGIALIFLLTGFVGWSSIYCVGWSLGMVGPLRALE